MAGLIEKYGLDNWVISLFEGGKTTREIEQIINANPKPGQEPISQPTIARFLKPYRDAINSEKKQIINREFPDDLALLNLLISKNAAIATGKEWDEKENCPVKRPDGTFKTRHYKPTEQIQASKVAISAILKKFEHLNPEERQIYQESAGPGGGPIPTEGMGGLSDDQLNARISNLLQRMGMGGTPIAA